MNQQTGQIGGRGFGPCAQGVRVSFAHLEVGKLYCMVSAVRGKVAHDLVRVTSADRYGPGREVRYLGYAEGNEMTVARPDAFALRECEVGDAARNEFFDAISPAAQPCVQEARGGFPLFASASS
jgi:hypothetical protein